MMRANDTPPGCPLTLTLLQLLTVTVLFKHFHANSGQITQHSDDDSPADAIFSQGPCKTPFSYTVSRTDKKAVLSQR